MAEVLIIPAISCAIAAANLVISPILSRLVNKCFDALDLDPTFPSTNKELAKKLENLQTMLIPQLTILIDATQKSPHRRTLEAWLQRLKAAYSEAESLLTLLENGGGAMATSKPNSKLKPSELKSNREKLLLSLQNIETIVEEASKLVTMLNLSTNHSNSIEYRETISTPGFEIVARGNDQDRIIDLLCEDIPKSSSNNAKCYSVVGIWGMAGLGKTTLAQYVCKSEKIRQHFKLIIWAHVPQDLNVKSIFERIWESAFKEPCPDFKSAEGLQCKLQEKLKGQRFLLVLDDARCNEEGITEQIKLKFQQLFAPLQYAESNSKVLVTTRVEGAARALGASKLIQLQELDKKEFMNLFRSRALCDVEEDHAEKHLESLKQIGDCLVASKLYRSPLAATTMAAQLRKGLDQDPDYWSKLVKAHQNTTLSQQPEKTSTEVISTSSAKRRTSTPKKQFKLNLGSYKIMKTKTTQKKVPEKKKP